MFDCFCRQKQCLSNKKCFIVENQNHQHAIEPIHRITIEKMIRSRELQSMQPSVQDYIRNKVVNEFSDLINKRIDYYIENIRNNLNNLFRPTLDLLDQIRKSIDGFTIKGMQESLQKGNYFLLKSLFEFQADEKQICFTKFYQQKIRKVVDENKKQFNQQTYHQRAQSLDNLSKTVLTMAGYQLCQQKKNKNNDVIISQVVRQNQQKIDRQDGQQIVCFNNQDIAKPKPSEQCLIEQNLIKQEQINSKSQIYNRMQEERVQEYDPIQDNQFLDDDQQQQEDVDQQVHNNRKITQYFKNKPINKENKAKKRKLRYIPCSGIKQISNTHITIKQAHQPDITLKHILKKYPTLKILYIMTHQMATSMILLHILQGFPHLQVLNLCCNHQFRASLLSNLTEQRLKSLTINVKWQMNKCFQYYFGLEAFPREYISQRERKERVVIPQQLQRKLNQTQIVICDVPGKIDFNKKTSAYIDIYPKKFEVDLIDVMRPLYDFVHITELVLKGLIFKGWSQQIGIYFSKCYQLKLVVIEECLICDQREKVLNNLVSCLPGTLQKLAICAKTSGYPSPTINLHKIAQYSCLHYLHLNGINIDLSSKTNREDEYYLKQQENIYLPVNQLSRLTYLSLPKCKNIDSSFIMGLSRNLLTYLKSLDLNQTNIDQTCVQAFKKMKNMQNLALSWTRISCEDLIDIQKHIYINMKNTNPLRNLNISGCQKALNPKIYVAGMEQQQDLVKSYTVKNLRELSRYLPYLQYLNIACASQIKQYNFKDFKALKYLTIDRDQMLLLPIEQIKQARIQVFVEDYYNNQNKQIK